MEQIIKEEAEQFYFYGNWKKHKETPADFKNAIEIELYNHNEPTNKLIYLYEIINLIKIDYSKHLKNCNYPQEPFKCEQNKWYLTSIYYVEQLIAELNPEFEFSIIRPEINVDLIKKNIKELNDYPDVEKIYQNGIEKLKLGKFERNILDDFR